MLGKSVFFFLGGIVLISIYPGRLFDYELLNSKMAAICCLEVIDEKLEKQGISQIQRDQICVRKELISM